MVRAAWMRMFVSNGRRGDAPEDNGRGGVMPVRRRLVQVKHPLHRRLMEL
jgi:hypothetical protein